MDNEDITVEFYYKKAKYKGRTDFNIKKVIKNEFGIIVTSDKGIEYNLSELTDFSF